MASYTKQCEECERKVEMEKKKIKNGDDYFAKGANRENKREEEEEEEEGGGGSVWANRPKESVVCILCWRVGWV